MRQWPGFSCSIFFIRAETSMETEGGDVEVRPGVNAMLSHSLRFGSSLPRLRKRRRLLFSSSTSWSRALKGSGRGRWAESRMALTTSRWIILLPARVVSAEPVLWDAVGCGAAGAACLEAGGDPCGPPGVAGDRDADDIWEEPYAEDADQVWSTANGALPRLSGMKISTNDQLWQKAVNSERHGCVGRMLTSYVRYTTTCLKSQTTVVSVLRCSDVSKSAMDGCWHVEQSLCEVTVTFDLQAPIISSLWRTFNF